MLRRGGTSIGSGGGCLSACTVVFTSFISIEKYVVVVENGNAYLNASRTIC
jgi:hypothetical protein